MLSHFSHVWLFATSWTIAHQAPLSMGFCRLEYWSGLAFLSPGDLPDPGIKPESSAFAGRLLIIWATREAHESGKWYHSILTLPFLSAFPTQEHPHLLGHNALEKEDIWTSLVVQWIGIHLPKQGTQGDPGSFHTPWRNWAYAPPTLEPVSHNSWLVCYNCEAHML